MFFKRQSSVKSDTKMFMGCILYYIIIIKNYWRIMEDFRLKMTSCACFFNLGWNSFSTETAIYLSLPSHYSVKEQRYCYHESHKTRTYLQQIVMHLEIIFLINRWYILKTIMDQLWTSGEYGIDIRPVRDLPI